VPHFGVTVDHLGYALAVAFTVVLLWYAVRERRWWSWLQVAGIAVLVVAAVGVGWLPPPAELAAQFAGPALLVGGLLAWRLHWDAGWFGGDDLHPPSRDAPAERVPDPRSDNIGG
jgi:O-antigen/teichoic acid export membrane protein